jgi:hypothetical protein
LTLPLLPIHDGDGDASLRHQSGENVASLAARSAQIFDTKFVAARQTFAAKMGH